MENLLLSYIEENSRLIKEKSKHLEEFRNKEESLRLYEDALGDLEKTKVSSQIDTFYNIKEKLISFLLNFNPEDIIENVNEVKSVIEFIKNKEAELKKLSEIFLFIQKNWVSFLTRRNPDDMDSVFIEEVNEKIQSLNDAFYSAGINDIGRIEEVSNDLRQEILKIINLFEDLYLLLDLNVFIGEEAIDLKREIEDFLNVDFYESNLIDLYKRKEQINTFIKDNIAKDTSYIKKGLEVIKIQKKDKLDYYFYTVKINDYLLEINNEKISREEYNIISTGKFIYIDNYPEKGIFKIEEIKQKINISLSQYQLMNDFDKTTNNLFITFSLTFLFSGVLYLLNVFSIFFIIFLLLALSGAFYHLFYFLLRKYEKKYEVPNSFFFIPTNFYFLKIGDNHLNYKDLILALLINSEKTILKDGE